MENGNGRVRQRLTTVVAYVITGVWACSFLVDIVVKEYDPNPALTPIMLLVAGYLFREGVIPRKRDSKNGNGKETNTNTAN